MEKQRKGVILLGHKQAAVKEFPLPKPGMGELMIRVKSAGICGSDLHFYRSTPEELGIRRGVVIGHEPSGIVQEVGPGVSHFHPGDRVTVNHTIGCGSCEYCLAGETVLCSENIGMAAAGYGGDTDYMLMPARNCFHLPAELSFVEGSFIACTGATAYNALRTLNLSGRETLAVFGLGPVGLSAVLVGKALGATVFGVDILPERLSLAKELGAAEIVHAQEADPLEVIRVLTHGRGADCVLETSGSPVGQSSAVDVVCPQGQVAFVGLDKGEKSISPSQFVHKQAILVGVKVMPASLYHEMTRFLLDRHVRFESLVTHRFSLDEGPSAFAQFDGGAAGKCIFEMP